MDLTGRDDSNYRRWPTGLLLADKPNLHFLSFVYIPNFGLIRKNNYREEGVDASHDNCLNFYDQVCFSLIYVSIFISIYTCFRLF